MNKATPLLVAGILLATTAIGLAEKVEADIDGATPGKWTMDFEAAKMLAAEKKLPILLDFSGSDWCHWCEVMEENVFTKPEWAAYAKDNLVMVLLDFPSDKSLVPEKYVERNKALQAEFDVKSFPSFIVLDDDGTTKLGKLGAGRDKTPASFQSELQALFSKRAAAKAKYAESLSPEARVEFNAINARMAKQKAAGKMVDAELADAMKRAKEIEESMGKLEDEVREFKVKQLGEEAYKEYQVLKASFESKRKELEDWIGTKPERTEENTVKFQAMQSEIQAITTKLESY